MNGCQYQHNRLWKRGIEGDLVDIPKGENLPWPLSFQRGEIQKYLQSGTIRHVPLALVHRIPNRAER
jgi:hypothetical protein